MILLCSLVAANKEELMEIITHGADKIINSADECVHSISLHISYYRTYCPFLFNSLIIDDDIEEIIHRGDERTETIKKKYEGFNFDDLNNFKSDSMLQWEGEDYQNGVRRTTPLTAMQYYLYCVRRHHH